MSSRRPSNWGRSARRRSQLAEIRFLLQTSDKRPSVSRPGRDQEKELQAPSEQLWGFPGRTVGQGH